ncbi:acidic phospholipase A2 6-like isoform X2 [Dendrobates tinctorius]|uniref:acidic phospholipase A2 6-like isoform X2 n=1 Tax=Dendrobates tinctorius TaxID=92724 RepID=UPI003CC9F178
MITWLLLLLSLGSVEGRKFNLPIKNFNNMLKETMNQEMADALPYGCLCVSSASNQNVEHIERCCALSKCCREAIGYFCLTGFLRYTFTYSNGIIRCVTAMSALLQSHMQPHYTFETTYRMDPGKSTSQYLFCTPRSRQ